VIDFYPRQFGVRQETKSSYTAATPDDLRATRQHRRRHPTTEGLQYYELHVPNRSSYNEVDPIFFTPIFPIIKFHNFVKSYIRHKNKNYL
jgi:hypothetical protein